MEFKAVVEAFVCQLLEVCYRVRRFFGRKSISTSAPFSSVILPFFNLATCTFSKFDDRRLYNLRPSFDVYIFL